MNKIINYDISKIHIDKNREFFMEMIPYISEKIISYQLNEHKNMVVLTINDSDDTDVFENLKMLLQLSNIDDVGSDEESGILLDNKNNVPINTAQIYEALLERGDVYELAKGYFSYSGTFLLLMKYFHDKIKEFAFENFNIEEIDFPISMPLDRFRQGGHFETFPHHIMFHTCMNNNLKLLSDFSNVEDNFNIKNMKNPNMVIKNSACAPIYMLKEDQDLDKTAAFFVKDKCQRNEASNVCELSRLNEFNMVELVFIGSEDEVNLYINQSKKIWDIWIDTFQLNCYVTNANDSFFASNYKKLKFFQLLGNSKLEFKMLLPHNKQYTAVSSINYHRTHFSKKYNIKYKNSLCYSACIGFGLERLAYAFLAQMGLDIDKWPVEVRNELNNYISLGEE